MRLCLIGVGHGIAGFGQGNHPWEYQNHIIRYVKRQYAKVVPVIVDVTRQHNFFTPLYGKADSLFAHTRCDTLPLEVLQTRII